MKNKTKGKAFKVTYVQVGDKSEEIIKNIVGSELKKALALHGVIAYNLDDVLSKYITGEMRNG